MPLKRWQAIIKRCNILLSRYVYCEFCDCVAMVANEQPAKLTKARVKISVIRKIIIRLLGNRSIVQLITSSKLSLLTSWLFISNLPPAPIVETVLSCSDTSDLTVGQFQMVVRT
jgi:hypothetical protein